MENLTAEIISLDDLTPDPENANVGNDRGESLLVDSIHRLGAGRSILVDKNGQIIAGNKTAAAAKKTGHDSAILVKTDGNALVAVKRSDLDLARDPDALRLALADNRIGELNLEWDSEMILALADRYGEDITDKLWSPDEILALAGDDSHAEDVPPEPDLEFQPGIIVHCRDENHQFELLEKFISKGLQCRALIS